MVGGHLIEAEVAVTAELTVNVFSTPIGKIASPIFGGTIIDLASDPAASPLLPARAAAK